MVRSFAFLSRRRHTMAFEDCPTEIALKQGRIVRGREAIIERPDGTRVPIIPYPTPLRDGAGAIVGVVNMMVDITELKKAERALAERNMQLALAGKAGLVGSYAYDVDTENDAGLRRLCGHPRFTRGNYRKLAQRMAAPRAPRGSCASR